VANMPASSRKSTRRFAMSTRRSRARCSRPGETSPASDPAKTHNGYFSIDKKTNRLKNPELGAANSTDADDVDAYDLILRDKEATPCLSASRPGSSFPLSIA